MDFLERTIGWTKGEIFESATISMFGILTILVGLVFGGFGETPTAKVLLIPLLAVGAILVAVGTSG